jgi:hypothetical protein
VKGRKHHAQQKSGHETSAAGIGIRERRWKVENDDEPNVCDVEAIDKEHSR